MTHKHLPLTLHAIGRGSGAPQSRKTVAKGNWGQFDEERKGNTSHRMPTHPRDPRITAMTWAFGTVVPGRCTSPATAPMLSNPAYQSDINQVHVDHTGQGIDSVTRPPHRTICSAVPDRFHNNRFKKYVQFFTWGPGAANQAVMLMLGIEAHMNRTRGVSTAIPIALAAHAKEKVESIRVRTLPQYATAISWCRNVHT